MGIEAERIVKKCELPYSLLLKGGPMRKTTPLFRTVIVLVAAQMAGCVTTQGGSPLVLSTPSIPSLPSLSSLPAFSDFTDTFNPQVRELKKLMAESKYAEAEGHFSKHREFFEKRHAENDKSLPEISALGEYVWRTRYQERTESVLARLRAATSFLNPATWAPTSSLLDSAQRLSTEMVREPLLQLTKAGTTERSVLETQVARIEQTARNEKPSALGAIAANALATGRHDPLFVGTVRFSPDDFVRSQEFQRQAVDRIKAKPSRDEVATEAVKLGSYLSQASKNSIDSHYVDLTRRDLVAGGRISLEQVSALTRVSTPFGGAKDSLKKLVNIGYVDLTAASFKDRNIFDFEVAFKQDVGLDFNPAAESVFTNAEISKFDFVFVTDLSVAKVSRKFRAKNEVSSRVQTGTRETPNPEYVRAMTAYQRALSEYQTAQISSNIPKACVGWGCALQGLADGLQVGAAKNSLDSASSALGSTSRTLSVPVYADYAYQRVEIDTTKTADVTYYLIDVAGKRIYKNSFQVNNNEVFGVAYNVRTEDPDRASILRNVKSEDDVTAWEKRPITVEMSKLFNPENLRAASHSPYTDIQAFLASLNTRTYAAASPTYAAASKTPASTRATSDTIADERFESIVIVRNARKAGTGFYVTPDLVLTAYHVVDGSSLVEMTFYDGTKTYGRVIDHDVRLDLALIRAQTAGKPLKIHSGPIKLGETVEAIGHPQGYEFTITRGVVSAIRKQRGALGSNVLVEFVQTDTPISPGNSGGPLLLKDAVVGVNDWIRVDRGSQNLNFSVSYNELRGYLDRMKGK